MNRYEKMTRKQLEEIICSYMNFSNYTRKEMEEKYEDLSKYVERIIWYLFICATVAIYWLNMSNNINIERLERKVYKLEKVIEEQNEQIKSLEETIDIMVDEFVFEE